MFGSLNKVQLIGNLGKDPETRSFQNGGKVASFSVACAESWKDKSTGERKEKTEWVNVSVWGDGLVGLVERFIKKGSRVYVEGQLQTRKWQDQSGNDRYSTEVVVRGFGSQVLLLDKKDSGSGGGRQDSGSGYAGSSQGEWDSASRSSGSGARPQPAAFDSDLDDDVPF
jgi:single-strand DNA-binding protein